MRVRPEVRLVIERKRDRRSARRRHRLGPGHELVLVHEGVRGVGRRRDGVALDGPVLLEARLQVVGARIAHVAAAVLVAGHVVDDRDGEHRRRVDAGGAGEHRRQRRAGGVAARQVGVVLEHVVAAGVRRVRLPVVGGHPVAARAQQPVAVLRRTGGGRRSVDERRDRVRVDLRAHVEGHVGGGGRRAPSAAAQVRNSEKTEQTSKKGLLKHAAIIDGHPPLSRASWSVLRCRVGRVTRPRRQSRTTPRGWPAPRRRRGDRR